MYEFRLEASDTSVSIVACAIGLVVSRNKRVARIVITDEDTSTVLVKVPIGDDILWRCVQTVNIKFIKADARLDLGIVECRLDSCISR